MTTAKGLKIYSRVEHVPLKKKWCYPRGQSGYRIHSELSMHPDENELGRPTTEERQLQ